MSRWQHQNNALEADFIFKDFSECWAFMTRVAMEAEKMNHHPTWTNVWNKVSISLSTHEAGNVVTDKDHKLSEIITQLYTSMRK